MKQDRKQVSKQPWEPKYVADKFDVNIEDIKVKINSLIEKQKEDMYNDYHLIKDEISKWDGCVNLKDSRDVKIKKII